MYCQICGIRSEDVKHRVTKHRRMCDACSKETPRKAGRVAFDRKYWGVGVDSVPPSTKREFYSDYLSSTQTLDAYIDATTEELC